MFYLETLTTWNRSSIRSKKSQCLNCMYNFETRNLERVSFSCKSMRALKIFWIRSYFLLTFENFMDKLIFPCHFKFYIAISYFRLKLFHNSQKRQWAINRYNLEINLIQRKNKFKILIFIFIKSFCNLIWISIISSLNIEIGLRLKFKKRKT
jgi:hypothetical protein